MARLSASEGRVAAHGFSRGIQGVCELVHTLGGLGHPEITRGSLIPTLSCGCRTGVSVIWGGGRTLEEAAHRSNDERAAWYVLRPTYFNRNTPRTRHVVGVFLTWSSRKAGLSSLSRGSRVAPASGFPRNPAALRGVLSSQPPVPLFRLLPRLPSTTPLRCTAVRGLPAVVPEIRVQRLFATVFSLNKTRQTGWDSPGYI